VVEAAEGIPESEWETIARAIEQRSRDVLALRPQVTILPFGALPRSSQKTKLIEITG